MTHNVLEIAGLSLTTTAGRPILKGVDLTVHQGEILALVGESGSGKTTVGLAALGRFRPGLVMTGGSVTLHPSNIDVPVQMTELDDRAVRALRGSRVSYIPQDPALSLNPSMRVGAQIREVLDVHGFGSTVADREARVSGVLQEVGLPGDTAYQRHWPHQLSGGQQQRIGIAMAFAMYPDLLVLDEPTTGLDVSTQALVLETIRNMTEKYGVAGLYITHDLAVVDEIADRVAVMLRGELVEEGLTAEVLRAPKHRYTKTLLAAVPDLAGRNRISRFDEIRQRVDEAQTSELPLLDIRREEGAPLTEAIPVFSAGEPLLEVSGLSLSYGEKRVLDGIELTLKAAECTMLLGESGSGKTTLSRSLAGLIDRWKGDVSYLGEPLNSGTRRRTAQQRQELQYIFQSPFSSLNPRRTLGDSLGVPLEMSGGLSAKERRERVADALDAVRLGRRFIDRRPGDLSGGERQRAAIARALVNAPRVLICDEITSALDVSVQASIIDLLTRLREERGLSLLFVTHNIALARHVAKRIAVLHRGVIVDEGLTDDVLSNPTHDYTRGLLENVPTLD